MWFWWGGLREFYNSRGPWLPDVIHGLTRRIVNHQATYVTESEHLRLMSLFALAGSLIIAAITIEIWLRWRYQRVEVHGSY